MIFDTSALAALLLDEPGADVVERALNSTGSNDISAVNLVELLLFCDRKGVDGSGLIATLNVVPFGRREADLANEFVRPNISLGDRCCLGTAVAQAMPGQPKGAQPSVYTGDKQWTEEFGTRKDLNIIQIR